MKSLSTIYIRECMTTAKNGHKPKKYQVSAFQEIKMLLRMGKLKMPFCFAISAMPFYSFIHNIFKKYFPYKYQNAVKMMLLNILDCKEKVP